MAPDFFGVLLTLRLIFLLFFLLSTILFFVKGYRLLREIFPLLFYLEFKLYSLHFLFLSESQLLRDIFFCAHSEHKHEALSLIHLTLNKVNVVLPLEDKGHPVLLVHLSQGLYLGKKLKTGLYRGRTRVLNDIILRLVNLVIGEAFYKFFKLGAVHFINEN